MLEKPGSSQAHDGAPSQSLRAVIDLHCHILYGLDDGPATLEEAMWMARAAADDGTRLLAATPHSPGSTASRRYSAALIRERVTELNAALRAGDVPLTVVPGTEVASSEPDLVRRLERGDLLAYGSGRTILLELPWDGRVPRTLGWLLDELREAGYRVVLAHPERTGEIQDDPERLAPFVERGLLVQVTAASLVGAEHGPRETAEALLVRGLAHVMASDGHGPHRSPVLTAGYRRAVALVGENAADALVTSGPDAVLHDRSLGPGPA